MVDIQQCVLQITSPYYYFLNDSQTLADFNNFFTTRRVCIARTMPWQDVCLSVCPFVRHTPVLCLNYYIYPQSFFHHRVAPPFQFLHTKRDGDILTGTLLTGASNARGMKKSWFLTHLALFWNWCKIYHSYYGRWIGNRTQAFEWYHFEWPWVSNLDFKVTISSDVK